jgi:electron transport complex protein RnfA
MEDLLKLAVATALINNVVLSQFLGLCPFLGVSKKTKTAASMGVAVIFVLTIASACSNIVYEHVLVRFNVEYCSCCGTSSA